MIQTGTMKLAGHVVRIGENGCIQQGSQKNQKETDSQEDIGVDERKILKLILDK
jgi:hypothetical protein